MLVVVQLMEQAYRTVKSKKGAGMTVARAGFGSRLSRNGLVLVEPHGSGGASAGILVA